VTSQSTRRIRGTLGLPNKPSTTASNEDAEESFGNRKVASEHERTTKRKTPKFPEMSGFASMSYKEQFPEMKRHPLEMVDRCQTAFTRLETSFRRQRYEMVALVYGFALIARDDPATLSAFKEKPFWEHRKYTVNSGVLQLAMQYCLSAPNDSTMYGRACTYARALSSFFDQDVPMEKIPKLIEDAGGLDKLARQNGDPDAPDPRGKKRPTSAARAVVLDSDARVDRDVHRELSDDSDDDLPNGSSERQGSAPMDDPATQRRGRSAHPPQPDWTRQALVDMGTKRLARATSYPDGTIVSFDAIITGEPGEWRKFEAISLAEKES
jgi:hypothetical protein